ncbi:autotransporter outer membrane beta-barrel domain-containing protein [Martelella mangrovi]|uniref:Outer membrane autotransporter protein n=1 Tax=Martelella mangrovi TaxID=1397477 RepID=A0ABV2ICP3_9HYPH
MFCLEFNKKSTTVRLLSSVSLAASAGSLWLLGAGMAAADSECGSASDGTVTCDDASYASITYNTSGADNLTLNLDNAAMAISGPVLLQDTDTSSTADLVIDAKSFDTITTTAANAHAVAAKTSGLGTTTVNFSSGTITTSGGNAYALDSEISNSAATGDAVANMTGGTITLTQTTQGTRGIVAYNNGTGDAIATMSGGSITSTSINVYGVYARAQQGNAHVVISGTASVINNSTTDPTANQFGVSADSYGSGEALVEMSGGHVEAWRRPVQANVHSTSASSDAVIKFTGGTVISESDYALTTGNFGSGDSIVTMDDSDGPSNITVGQNFAPSPSGCCNAPWGVNASISNGGTGSAYASLSGGLDTATIDVYQKSGEAYGVIALVNSSVATGSATAVMNGGTITLYGDPAGSSAVGVASYNYGYGDASVAVNGGKIIVQDGATAGVYVTGTANVISTMTGGEIDLLSDTDDAGIVANHGSYGLRTAAYSEAGYQSLVEMTGGTINASGYGSIGVKAYNYETGASVINLAGGTINVTGDGLAAIAMSNRTGGGSGNPAYQQIITIGPDMVIDASTSSFGYALWNGDPSGDNNVVLTTAGSVAGDAMMGSGSSTFTLSGGSWTGDIYGDFDPNNPIPGLATPVQGSDNFIWTGGTLNSGFYGQGGNDTATISVPNSPSFAAAIFDGGEDGGAPESEISSDSDTITFTGNNDGLMGNNIRHWEKFTVANNATVGFADGSMTLDGYDGGNANDLGLATITPGATLMGGLTSPFTLNANLVNAGALSMQDGLTGGNFIIGGDYQSTAGRLGLDVDFYNLQSDVVTFGGAIDGFSRFDIADVTGANRARFGAILIADTTVATAIDRNEFAVERAGKTASGLYAYALYYNLTGDPNIGSTPGLYLYADPDSIQPFIPLYEGYQSALLEMNTLPTMRQRVGKRYWLYDDVAVVPMLTPKDEGYYAQPMTAGADYKTTPAFDAVWGRIDGGFDHIDPTSSTLDYDYDLSQFEAQAGVDGLFLDNGNGRLFAGLTGHYRTGEAKFSSRYGDSKLFPDGWGFGGTLTWLGDNGFYTDAQAEATWYSSEMKAEDLYDGIEDSDAFGYALSLEAGQQIGFGDNNMLVTPQAQLMWSSVDIDSLTGAYNDDAAFNDGDSLTARLGLALEHESHWKDESGLSRKGNVYGIANIYYDFDNKTKATVEQFYTLETELDAWTGEIGFGGTYDWEGANEISYGIYGEVTASMGFDSSSYGYGGNVGFRVRW